MKKIFTTIILLLTITISSVADSENSNSSGLTKIEMDIINTSGDEFERSINIPIIQAIFYSNIKEAVVNLYNIGDATVSLVNANGKVIETLDVATDTPTTVTLHVDDSSNTYYIVVLSPVVYAEGSFDSLNLH